MKDPDPRAHRAARFATLAGGLLKLRSPDAGPPPPPEEDDLSEGEPGRTGSPRASPLAEVYGLSTAALLAGADQARRQGWTVRIQPVCVQAVVADVVKGIVDLTAASSFRVIKDADAGSGIVCRADPVWLRKIVAHLLLRALTLEVAPPYVRLKVCRGPGEIHLLILSSAPDVQRDDRGDLRAIRSLLEAMGAELALEARRGGFYPLNLILAAGQAAQATGKAA